MQSKAARADTRGLAKAISIIGALIAQGVPVRALDALNAALAALRPHRAGGAGGEVPGGTLGGLPIPGRVGAA